jgi:hypothetical protein
MTRVRNPTFLLVAPSYDGDDFCLTVMSKRHRFIRGLVAWIRGTRLPLVNDHESRVASYPRPPTPIANC